MNLLNNLEIKKRIKDIFEGKEKINKEVNFLGSSFNEDEKLDLSTFLNVFSELNYQIEDKLYLTPKDSVFENKEVNNLIDKLVKIAILKNKSREGAVWYIKTKRKPTSYFIRKIAKDLKTSSFGSNNNLLIFNWDEKDQFLFVFPFFTLNQIELRKLQIDKNNLYQTDLEVLSNIFVADEKVFIQKLWLEAFNVEKVSKKFFLEYLDIFKKLMVDLEKQNSHLKYNLFSEKSKIENFAKILLGRLMFLYFIQKKGWLNCYGAWGTGDKRFLFNKFKEAKKLGKNYFKDYLEPLFFETLNNPDRNKADNSTRFGGRIPFLNGGLFEPNYPYKDLAYKVILNNETFEYIFEVFESYNFTVKEDEPLEKEVAVDPEMLGKVFENLIEENLRKGKGAFYTPREIVSYMSHQSLVYYLSQELNIEEFKIKKFLETKGESYKEDLKSKAKDIIDKLKSIKIVDPACGSGAFLIGVLHEILEARLLVNKLVDKKETQSLYQIKKEIIENNIYGVDIDEGAVEIAKLRLWLSLVVDHDLSEIDPLPNLDYKIMVGNSLVDSILINKKQIKLFDYYYFKEKKKENYKNLFEKSVVVDLFEQNLYESEIKLIVEKIRAKKIKLFETSDFKEKLSLRKEINKLENELIKKSLKKEYKEINSRLLNDRSIDLTEKTQLEMIREELNNLINNEDNLNLYKKQNIFLWELNFIEVFDEKDGFDIVIANPPYIQLQKNNGELANLYQDLNYITFDRTGDIYCLFYEKGLDILKNGGILTYITSNKWMRSGYGEKLRNFFTKFQPLGIIDLGPNIFESATVDTNIIFIKKVKNYRNKIKAITFNHEDKKNLSEALDQSDKHIEISSSQWFVGSDIEYKLKEKIEKIGKPLKDWDVKIYRGILTGLNEAFIITTEKRNKILANCKDEDERRRTESIIKPILRGKDIKRYYYDWAGLWVIIIPAGWTNKNKGKEKADIFIERYYPALMNHLKVFKEKALKRYDKGDYWWELRHCDYYEEFEKEKIIWQELTEGSQFAYDLEGRFYVTNTAYILTGRNLKYILGILNSKFIEHIYREWYCTTLGNKGTRWLHQHIVKLPIPLITHKNKNLAERLELVVKKIIVSKENKIIFDKEINELVNSLYEINYLYF